MKIKSIFSALSSKSIILYAVAVYLLVNLFNWLTFFPGWFDADSYAQFREIFYLNLGNMHPAINQIIGLYLYKIWQSSGVFIFFQIVLGLVNLILLVKVFITYRVPKPLIIVLSTIYATLPYILFFNIYLLRDMVFAYLYSMITIVLLLTHKQQRLTILYYGSFVFLNVWISLVRHNGLPLLVLFSVCFAVITPEKKRVLSFLAVFITSIIGYILVTRVVYPLHNVHQFEPSFPYYSYIHDVAAVIDEGLYVFTPEEHAYYSKILPFEYWKKFYVPDDRNILLFHKAMYPNDPIQPDLAFFEENMTTSLKMLMFTLSRNLPLVLQRHAFSFVKLIAGNTDQYKVVFETPQYMNEVSPDPSNALLCPQKLPFFNKFDASLASFFGLTIGNPLFVKLTSPTWGILFLFFLSFLLFVKRKYRLFFILAVPIFFYLLTFYLSPTNNCICYMLFIYTYLFITPCFFMKEK